MTQEKEFRPMTGWLPLFPVVVMILGGFVMFIVGCVIPMWELTLAGLVAFVAGLICSGGFLAIQPNSARVLLLFGDYKGSVTKSGFYWVNPFYSKKKVSLRVRNFETGSQTTPEQKSETGTILKARGRTHGSPSKVNDRDGNPIEITAVVVWRVVDTAEALFEVDDYVDYVAVQSESALRVLASRHPYDTPDEPDSPEISLRGNVEEVSDALRTDIQERLDKAGVKVVEARISHLAYAPEIAAAMLQRQQAQAVVAARTRIVDGAVGMVEMALERLSRENVIQMDDERRAAMVSNLMVVLCGGGQAHPVINTGTLYQ